MRATPGMLDEIACLGYPEDEHPGRIARARARGTAAGQYVVALDGEAVDGGAVDGGAVVAVALEPAAPGVPWVPRVRSGIDAGVAAGFLAELHGASMSGQRLLLQGDMLDVPEEVVAGAGWHGPERAVVCEVPLDGRVFPRSTAVRQYPPGDVAPAVRSLLDELGAGVEEDADLFVHVLDGRPVAAAWCWLDQPGCSVEFSGVLPAFRRRGIGAELMGHVMAVAAQGQRTHRAITDPDNRAMVRILDSLGGRDWIRQSYWTS